MGGESCEGDRKSLVWRGEGWVLDCEDGLTVGSEQVVLEDFSQFALVHTWFDISLYPML